METRRLIVLSGFDTRVADRLRTSLASRRSDVAFVKLYGDADEAYFHRLAKRSWELIGKAQQAGDQIVLGVVASALSSEAELARERECFFPALRRLSFDSARRRDINTAAQTADEIVGALTSDKFLALKASVKPSLGRPLLLPVRNTRSKVLRAQLERLYELLEPTPTANLKKEIVKLKGNRGLRVRGIDFASVVNNARHPVRRCTDAPACDLKAIMRLGFCVPDRFEFDVASDTGLVGKEFWICDGTTKAVSRSASHLNMRMNDDFGEGSK